MIKEPLTLDVDGLAIQGEFYFPLRRGTALPALLLCHGIPAGPHDPTDKGYPQLAERLCKEGFAVLIFNFRGAGLSQGNLDMLGWTRDLAAAVDYLWARPGLDRKRLFVLGFSAGAAVAVYVASRDKRIAGLALGACPARIAPATKQKAKALLQQCREVGAIKDPSFPSSLEAWIAGFTEVNPIRWIDKIAPRPLVLIHGEKDELFGPKQARILYDRAREPKELIILPGLGHRLRRMEPAISAALDWLRQKSELRS